jgi:hypothetical protein
VAAAQAPEVQRRLVRRDDLLMPTHEIAANPVPHGFISLKVESVVTER